MNHDSETYSGCSVSQSNVKAPSLNVFEMSKSCNLQSNFRQMRVRLRGFGSAILFNSARLWYSKPPVQFYAPRHLLEEGSNNNFALCDTGGDGCVMEENSYCVLQAMPFLQPKTTLKPAGYIRGNYSRAARWPLYFCPTEQYV